MIVYCAFKIGYDDNELHVIFSAKYEAENWVKLMNETHDTEDYIVQEWDVV